jgi:hypothetical protein
VDITVGFFAASLNVGIRSWGLSTEFTAISSVKEQAHRAKINHGAAIEAPQAYWVHEYAYREDVPVSIPSW